MTNGAGFSYDQMIQLVLDGQREIQIELKTLTEKVDRVISSGCAHRPDDLRRIDELESWRTRGIIGTISLAIGLIASFFAKHY